MKSQNRLAQRGLAAAALPDDPQDFTVIGSHRYIVNDMLFALFFSRRRLSLYHNIRLSLPGGVFPDRCLRPHGPPVWRRPGASYSHASGLRGPPGLPPPPRYPPLYTTITRSQISFITFRSWEIKRMDVLFSLCIFFSRRRIWAWTITSRAVVGSSAIIRSGNRPWPGPA